jgi:MarC family membrane protein
MTSVSAAILLFLVLDPLGNIPIFVTTLSRLEPKRARRVLVRELLIAYVVLALFLFASRFLLDLLQISQPTLSVSGGVVLFLIAIQMVFGTQEGAAQPPDAEPFIVPLAIPLIAGPSALATVMLLTARQPERWPSWLLALTAAWAAAGAILLCAPELSRYLGRRGLTALERLMGMVLTTVSIEMFLKGIRGYFAMP